MIVKKCENGHFYDGDKYQVCPHCGAAVAGTSASEQSEPEKRNMTFPGENSAKQDGIVKKVPEKTIGKTFGMFEEEMPVQKPQVVPKPAEISDSPASSVQKIKATWKYCKFCGNKISLTAKFCRSCGKPVIQNNTFQRETQVDGDSSKEVSVNNTKKTTVDSGIKVTEPEIPAAVSESVIQKLEKDNNDEQPVSSVRDSIKEQEPSSDVKNVREPANHPEQDEVQEDLSFSDSQSLQNELRKAASAGDGKTVGYFSMGSSYASEDHTEPVVGWLVCVKGNHLGESFKLEAGRNSVGRGISNRVILSKDQSVSREKHVWVTYEPKQREFSIQPGESNGLAYLNGTIVLETKKLNAKDSIEIGNGVYLLIPLCGPDFSWEEYIEG